VSVGKRLGVGDIKRDCEKAVGLVEGGEEDVFLSALSDCRLTALDEVAAPDVDEDCVLGECVCVSARLEREGRQVGGVGGDAPKCSSCRRYVVAGVDGSDAMRISERVRNALNDSASFVL
jgi:hypothetical protein